MRMTDSDLRLSDVRLVEWDLEMDTPRGPAPQTSKEVVPASDVQLLVEALTRLHHDPGVNPHNGKKAAKLVRITVATPALGDGYWWTGPTLQDQGPKARTLGWSKTVVWFDGEAIGEGEPDESGASF
jgi:hypothetical protein